MSIINSTGLYGDSYLFEDVETLKTSITEHDSHIDILESDNTSNEHDTRIDILEVDNTSSKSRLGILETDNTSSKSRLGLLETDNTSLQLYDTSFNLRLQSLEGTEGSPENINLGVPAIPSTGLIALTGSVALATAACIGVNGVTALAYIDSVDAKVDSNNTSLNLKNLLV